MSILPLISVIMPCYNRGELIARSIDSALNQTYKNIELIVINDGSTDNTSEVLKAIREKDARVRIIYQENKGPASARNRGLKEAKGEFIAFLDSDDTWNKTFLEKLHNALESDPMAVLAYCGWQHIGVIEKSDKPFIPPDYEAKPNKTKILLEGNRWPIHAALTRRAIIERIGGFQEKWLVCEDYELWLKIAAFNKIALVPEALAYYYYHKDSQLHKDRVMAFKSISLIRKKFLEQHLEIAELLGERRIKELTGSAKPSSFNYKLPWRVTSKIESLLEKQIRRYLPPFYRLARFSRLSNITRQVTQGPQHHFFGYYDKCPWNASGKLLLAHEVSFNDRPPAVEDVATVGAVCLNEGNRFMPLSETRAWNWQQGSMLQWHPADPEHLILYNDRRDNRFIGIARNIEGTEIKAYERPFYAVTPDGNHALSLNFSRLHEYRPGYGYAGVPDVYSKEKYPDDDGVYLMDLKTGATKLIISLRQLAEHQPLDSMRDAYHWVNHIQVNPKGNRFAFFHFWGPWENDSGRIRMYTANIDGSGLNCFLDGGTISHYDWMDERKILVWANLLRIGGRFILCDDRGGPKQVIGERILTEDGHLSFSPDRKWIIDDTYPDRYNLRTVLLFRMKDGKRLDIERLYSPKEKWWGEIRCDLHPRWSRDGKQACIDSLHTGERQMYIVDLKRIIE